MGKSHDQGTTHSQMPSKLHTSGTFNYVDIRATTQTRVCARAHTHTQTHGYTHTDTHTDTRSHTSDRVHGKERGETFSSVLFDRNEKTGQNKFTLV